MKVLHLNISDTKGASNAVHQIHNCLLNNRKVTSTLAVLSAENNFTDIVTLQKHSFFVNKLLPFVEHKLMNLFSKENNYWSLNLFPTTLSKKINMLDSDIVNIHWINRNMISIKDICILV